MRPFNNLPLTRIKIGIAGANAGVMALQFAKLAPRPAMIFEIGLYVMEERGIGFADYEEYFRTLGYRIADSKNGREITSANHLRMIPARGAIDAVALPEDR